MLDVKGQSEMGVADEVMGEWLTEKEIIREDFQQHDRRH